MSDRHQTVAAMDRHWWYRGRRAAVDGLLRRAGARRATGARSRGRALARPGASLRDDGVRSGGAPLVLDYGCGVGNMGATLARYGDVWGVEADSDALAAGDFSAYAGVIRAGSAAEAAAGGLPTGAFDIVTCLDVLEHVDDDAGLLRDLAALLRPGGIVVVSAPLHPELFCAVDEIAGHVRRYTADGLRRLVWGAGLRAVAESGYVVCLLPPARRQRRRVQAGRAAPEQEWAVPPAPVNAVLSAVALAEGAAARWVSLPAGLSLLVAARRDAGETDAHML